MPAPSTVSEFLELVTKSGVLDDKKLDAYLDKLRAGGPLPTRPNELAGFLVRDGLLTHFQAEQFLLGKWRRFTIGKYKVLERLGSGGMGSVYLCEHKLMRRRVAVKVLPTAKADDPSSLERFYREARAVAALDHPNIVRAYDIDQDEKLHFLVMEYVDGASLQELVKRGGPLDPIRAAHYIYQAAQGLQHAHEAAGLVHRDIKPGNVLVDRFGTVKVLDMGLARFFHDEEDILTRKYDENVLGTADYLAPEQALDSHSVDIRADIYSLGATFYYCLTGRTPFTEGTVAQKLIWHQTRQPKPILSLRADVPEALVAIVERMMAKDPAQRYQTPLEVAQTLEPWTQTPIGPPPDAEMPRLSLAAMGSNAPSDNQMLTLSPSTRGPVSPPPRKNWQATSAPTPRGPSTSPAGATMPPAAPTAPTPAPPTRPSRPQPVPPPTSVRAPMPPPAPAPAPTAVTRPAPNVLNGQPQPAPAVQPTPQDDRAPWEQFGADIASPGAQAETAPHSADKGPASVAGSSMRLKAEAAQKRARPWWELVLVGMFVFAAVAAGFIYLLTLIFSRPEGTVAPTAPESRTLYVNRTAGAGGVFRTVEAALRKVRVGDHIVIQDPTVDEEMHLDRAVPKGITIEGESGKTVVWRGSKGLLDSDSLVSLGDVDGLHLRNLAFDGGGRLQKLILLTGNCPDLTLENLDLHGFTRCAVLVMHCKGEPGHLVVLKDLFIHTSKEVEAGLLFDLNPDPAKFEIQSNDFFRIQGCRFDGQFKSQIQTKGTAKYLQGGNNVQIVGGEEKPVPLPQ